MDLATLGAAAGSGNPKRGNVGIAIGAVVGVTALDVVRVGKLGQGSAESNAI